MFHGVFAIIKIMSTIDNTVVITANTFDKTRLNNFYLTNVFQ